MAPILSSFEVEIGFTPRMWSFEVDTSAPPILEAFQIVTGDPPAMDGFSIETNILTEKPFGAFSFNEEVGVGSDPMGSTGMDEIVSFTNEPLVATSWDDVLALSPDDGDSAYFVGVKFRYDAANIMWVPWWAYDRTLSDTNTIDGDEANDAALTAKGWTLKKTGSGSTAYDGTRVRFLSMISNADLCFASTPYTGDATSEFFAYGRIIGNNFSGTTNRPGCGLVLRNGSHQQVFGFRCNTANQYAYWFDEGGSKNGSYDPAIDFASEKFALFSWRVTQGTVTMSAWVEGASSQPAFVYSGTNFVTTSSKVFDIGDLTGLAQGDVYVRNLVVARYI